jgi:putative Mg2+ transporter-C (MgtC) family protein
MLVALAAAVAMLQADLLLPTRGKSSDSFGVLDLMRLPLGILSGVGFIGAAAVFLRDDLVIGVTTAATLWFVTVMGLCFGGGQLALGGMGFALCIGTLSGIRHVEAHLKQEHRGTLDLTLSVDGPTDRALLDQIRGAGLTARRWSVTTHRDRAHRDVHCEVWWRDLPTRIEPPPLVRQLAETRGIIKVRWRG